jgi:hypothetical protein
LILAAKFATSILRAWGNWFMKKNKSRKSCDTVPFNMMKQMYSMGLRLWDDL